MIKDDELLADLCMGCVTCLKETDHAAFAPLHTGGRYLGIPRFRPPNHAGGKPFIYQSADVATPVL